MPGTMRHFIPTQKQPLKDGRINKAAGVKFFEWTFVLPTAWDYTVLADSL